MQLKHIIILISFICVCSIQVLSVGEIKLIEYLFPANNFNTTYNNTNMTGGTVINPQALTTFEISSNGYVTDPELRLGSKTNSIITYQDAINGNSYFTFNISPSLNKYYNITNITFLGAKGSTGNRGWGLKSSIDNYDKNISYSLIPSIRTTWTYFNIYGANLSNYININDTLNFRFYTYTSGTTASIEIDNITIWGHVYDNVTTNSCTITGKQVYNSNTYCNILTFNANSQLTMSDGFKLYVNKTIYNNNSTLYLTDSQQLVGG